LYRIAWIIAGNPSVPAVVAQASNIDYLNRWSYATLAWKWPFPLGNMLLAVAGQMV
jgi:hypothetical protein